MYVSTKETAKIIRRELKTLGYGPRMVSVRTDYYSIGSAVRVCVKSARVNVECVRAICSSNERIRRCEYSGEILNGGNLFITVTVSGDVERIYRETYTPTVCAAISRASHSPGSIFPILGVPGFAVSIDRAGVQLCKLWRGDTFHSQHFSPESCAESIGLAVGITG